MIDFSPAQEVDVWETSTLIVFRRGSVSEEKLTLEEIIFKICVKVL